MDFVIRKGLEGDKDSRRRKLPEKLLAGQQTVRQILIDNGAKHFTGSEEM